MSGPLIAALVCTIALLVVTAYFVMGSIPLLILRHDTPMDAWFVRRFFQIYYQAAFAVAAATTLSYGLALRPLQSAGAAVITALVVALRRTMLPRMAQLGEKIQARDLAAIPGFRRAHVTAILINLAQLVAIVWSLTATFGRRG